MLLKALPVVLLASGCCALAADPLVLVGTVTNTTNPRRPITAPFRIAFEPNGGCILTISPPLIGSGSCTLTQYDQETGRIEILSKGTPNISWSGTVSGATANGTYRIGVTSESGSFRLNIEQPGTSLGAIGKALTMAARTKPGELDAQRNLEPAPQCPGTVIAVWDNCTGTYRNPSGDEYIGEFRDGTLNGKGTLTYSSGGKYIGEFRNGNFNGQGTFTSGDGTQYVGEFRDGNYNGQGTKTLADGSTKQVGQFRDGKYIEPSSVTGAAAQTRASCTSYFTVVTQDRLNNVKQGLSPDDVKWFQKSFAKKYPGVCYAEPAPTVPIVFYISVTPDVYHGTRVVNQTSTHENPVSGTVTDQNGNTSQVAGTVQTTTTTSTAVPYSVQYGIFTLSVERIRSDGNFDVVHRFQQKGLYNTLYGIPLGGRGHHPVHAVIEDATKWVGSGGLTDPKQGVVGALQK